MSGCEAVRFARRRRGAKAITPAKSSLELRAGPQKWRCTSPAAPALESTHAGHVGIAGMPAGSCPTEAAVENQTLDYRDGLCSFRLRGQGISRRSRAVGAVAKG